MVMEDFLDMGHKTKHLLHVMAVAALDAEVIAFAHRFDVHWGVDALSATSMRISACNGPGDLERSSGHLARLADDARLFSLPVV